MKRLKVLLHTNENDRWKIALGNAENLLNAVGEGAVDVVMIGNGESVIAYEKSPYLYTMKALAEKGVTFLACRNSMKKMKEEGKISITEQELPAFVTVVPAGIVAIIEKQNEGYAYDKP